MSLTIYRQVSLDCFDAPECPPPNRQSDMEAEIWSSFQRTVAFVGPFDGFNVSLGGVDVLDSLRPKPYVCRTFMLYLVMFFLIYSCLIYIYIHIYIRLNKAY